MFERVAANYLFFFMGKLSTECFAITFSVCFIYFFRFHFSEITRAEMQNSSEKWKLTAKIILLIPINVHCLLYHIITDMWMRFLDMCMRFSYFLSIVFHSFFFECSIAELKKENPSLSVFRNIVIICFVTLQNDYIVCIRTLHTAHSAANCITLSHSESNHCTEQMKAKLKRRKRKEEKNLKKKCIRAR